MAGSVNNNVNLGFQINNRFQTELSRGDGSTAQNLRNQSGVTNTAKKSVAKKGSEIEEGSNLSEAARQQLQTEQESHAEHTAEHGNEMAHQAGIEPHGDTPERSELRSKHGYEREQEALADGPTPDGNVKLTSPEGKTQILTVTDHAHLEQMDDPDVTDRRVLDDIPDANLNAANATLDTQMVGGVSKVAVLKTDPKIDAVAEELHIDPLPSLVEPMDIVGPGSDKTSQPMTLEFPPEMEQVAAEKAARELASGQLQQEEFLTGPGLMSEPAMPTPGSLKPQPVETPPMTPERAQTLGTAVSALASTSPGAWPELAKILDVKPDQGLGVKPEGRGPEAQAQRDQWAVGQALSLSQSGHPDLAQEILQGKHSHLVGKSALEPLLQEQATRQQFDQHYGSLGQEILKFNESPEELDGKPVAFLARNPETGSLEEIRGTMQATESGSAIFELAELPGREFNRNGLQMALLHGDPNQTPAMPEVHLGAETPGPKPAPSTRAQALLEAAKNMNPRDAGLLLASAGVQTGQASGEAWKPGLSGQAAKDQVVDWQLGQASGLLAENRTQWAHQVLAGRYDSLAGQDLSPTLEQNAETTRDFQSHYAKNGASLRNSPGPFFSASAPEMAGKYVAFLQPNEKTGKLEEIRGVLQPAEGGNALFGIQGRPGQVFNTNDIDQMAVLPGAQVPPLAGSGATQQPATVAGIPATQLGIGAGVDQLDQFSQPLAKTQMEEARSHLNERQKKDLEQLEGDVTNIRGLYRQMAERPGDQAFATQAQKQIHEAQARIGEVASRHQAKGSNMQVIIDPSNGEVFTNLAWAKESVTPEMAAQGYGAVSYNLQSSPGRTDLELTAMPLRKDGQPDGVYMKYRVASGDPKGWQGVAAVVGDVNGENGFHASTVAAGDNTLHTHQQTDPNRMTASQRALAHQAMGDAGLTWPDGGTPTNAQAYQNRPGQPQQPVQRGFLDRMRYAFSGNPGYIGGAPPYAGPPPYWRAPQPSYNYMGSYPSYGYPPVNYGGYGGYAPGWGGNRGMNTMMKVMMATSMISSMAMPMLYFSNCMSWF